MKITGSLIGLLVIGAGIIGSWSVANYRISRAEEAIVTNHKQAMASVIEIQKKNERDHEILVRIDERLKRLESSVTRLASVQQ
jgi:hypothetical protein